MKGIKSNKFKLINNKYNLEQDIDDFVKIKMIKPYEKKYSIFRKNSTRDNYD